MPFAEATTGAQIGQVGWQCKAVLSYLTGQAASVGSGSVRSPVFESEGYQPRLNTSKELKDTCAAEVLIEPLAVDVGSCRIWPMGEGSERRSLRETHCRIIARCGGASSGKDSVRS